MLTPFKYPSFKLLFIPAIPLALFLCGPLYYYASNYWLGISHPAWFVWAILLLTAGSALYGGARKLPSTANIIDLLFLLFVLLVSISLAVHDLSGVMHGLYLLGINAVFPYGAARLLTIYGIGLMVRASTILCLLAIPITLAGLVNLSKDEFEQDRIHNLFGFYYSNNEVGLILGLCIVLLTVFILRNSYKRSAYYLIVSTLILFLCASLLTILTARGGLVASVIASLFLIFISTASPVKTRLVLLATLVVSIAVSVQFVPEKRKVFLGQLGIMSTNIPELANKYSIDKYPALTLKEGNTELPKEGNTERPKEGSSEQLKEGNSANIRLLYYMDAFNIILDNPILGVGSGNFGKHSPVVQLLSNNALCGDPNNGYVKCVTSSSFTSPHSSILHIISELGLIASGVIVSLVLLAAWHFHKLVRGTADQDIKLLGWYLGGMWIFFFMASQFYGNYFTDFQLYLLTGCISAFIAGQSQHNQQ